MPTAAPPCGQSWLGSKIKIESGELEPALVRRVGRTAVEPVNEHEIGRGFRAGSGPRVATLGMSLTSPSEFVISFHVKSFPAQTTPFVLAERLKLDPAEIEGRRSDPLRQRPPPLIVTLQGAEIKTVRDRRPPPTHSDKRRSLYAGVPSGPPVAAIASSGASAVLLSSVSVSGENAAFVSFHRSGETNGPANRCRNYYFKPAAGRARMRRGSLERRCQVTPHAIKRKEVHDRRQPPPELSGLQAKRERGDLGLAGDVVAELAVLDWLPVAIDPVGNQSDLAVVEGQAVAVVFTADGLGHARHAMARVRS